MRRTNRDRQIRMGTVACFLIAVGVTYAMSVSSKNKPIPEIERISKKNVSINAAGAKDNLMNAAKKIEAESKQAFLEAYKVFMHPRCMNCHPSGDVPLQGDDSHLHSQGVKRGKDGKGLYAMKCKNCHQDANLVGDNLPPGHPNWHLPPANRRMVFEGKSPRQLALAFKDPKFTGFNTMDKFLHHVEHDELVKHSFTYGEKPPLSHDAFAAKVREWVEKGAALPD